MTTATWSRLRESVRSSPRGDGLASNRMFVGGVLVLVAFGLLSFSRPILEAFVWDGPASVYDPVTGYDRAIDHPSGPSSGHALGTDTFGRDVLSVLVAATGATVAIAVSTALVTGGLALALGTLMAFWRGRVDQLLSHLADAVVLLPARW